MPRRASNEPRPNNAMALIDEYLFTPLISMFKSLFKRRPHGLHILIVLQFFLFAIYTFTWVEFSMRYLYMLKVFEDFNAAGYSLHYAYNSCGCLD